MSDPQKLGDVLSFIIRAHILKKPSELNFQNCVDILKFKSKCFDIFPNVALYFMIILILFMLVFI